MHNKNKEGLISAGIIFFIGTFVVAIINFLYHLVIGRMLGPVEYGVLSSLFAIIYLSSFATATFNNVISKYTSEFKSKNQFNFISYILKRGLRYVVIYGIILLLIYFLFTPFIAKYLNLDSSTGLFIVGIDIFVSLIFILFIGVLNGLQKFVWQNTASVITALLKFILGIFFIYIGYSVNGAIFALVLGSLAGIFIAYIPLKNLLKLNIKEKFETKILYLYSIPVFFAYLFPILLITLDLLLVKHYFSSYEAGLYSAASNIGKIIWFGSGFFVGALFPKIVSLKTENKDTSKLLIKAMFFTLFLSGIGCIIFFIIPNFIVNILYGVKYIEVSQLIGLFGIGMAFFSLTHILIAYNLALEKYNFIYILFIGLVVEILGISFYHESLIEIIKIFVVSNAIILGGILVYNLDDFFKNGI